MGNGSDELIDLLVRSFVRPGRKRGGPVAFLRHVSRGGRHQRGPIRRRGAAADFSVDEDALDAALAEADLLFLCSPNNPTGTILDQSLIQRLATRFQGLIAIDEAYGEFAATEGLARRSNWCGAGPKPPRPADLQQGLRAAGIRLGYGVACPAVVDVLLRIKPPYNVNVLTRPRAGPLEPAAGMEKTSALIAARDGLMEAAGDWAARSFPAWRTSSSIEPPASISAENIYHQLIGRTPPGGPPLRQPAGVGKSAANFRGPARTQRTAASPPLPRSCHEGRIPRSRRHAPLGAARKRTDRQSGQFRLLPGVLEGLAALRDRVMCW